jgi:uncharacterized protein YndB with AHSA1/START domain
MSKTIFTEMLEDKQMTVSRRFPAPLKKVWAAWTEKDLLEKWWAPKPYRAVSKSFDFSEGGSWHYYMESPEGQKHWSLVNYLEIDPQKYFTARDGFCDENANWDTNLPSNIWRNEFSTDGNGTQVLVTLTFVSADDMKKIVEMGFKEGFTLGLDQLEELLAKQ